jgi:hypothetical protein
MTQADSVLSTPPINTPIPDDSVPPRAPTPPAGADLLLLRGRLARAAGIPAERRPDREDRR